MEKISSPRERRKWSLGLGHNLKALGLTCARSQSSREINNATISEFSTFLKINKSREQFLLRWLNFWPFYAYRLIPLRPSFNCGTISYFYHAPTKLGHIFFFSVFSEKFSMIIVTFLNVSFSTTVIVWRRLMAIGWGNDRFRLNFCENL